MAREMMFGFRDEFLYFECAACGCLQLGTMITDWTKYYPRDYYAFASSTRRARSAIKLFLQNKRGEYSMGYHSLTGRLVSLFKGKPAIPDWVFRCGVGLNDSILDVGSGTGELLFQLRGLGFQRLSGLDPYIDSDIKLEGVCIQKGTIEKFCGSFDLVMFHHSFEHMSGPEAALKHAYRLTKPGKQIIIRVPVAGSYAWRKYRGDWIQLDAPRHIFIQTEKSMRLLAEAAGLIVEQVVYDSTYFQFMSELYLRNIPLRTQVAESSQQFSAVEMDRFESEAVALNAASDGDQACFYLRRPTDVL
jgi:SAM-dependent methyltransferase